MQQLSFVFLFSDITTSVLLAAQLVLRVQIWSFLQTRSFEIGSKLMTKTISLK